MKPGNESSEHARAVRAESVACLLVVLGLVAAAVGSFRGVVLAAIGVVLTVTGAFLLASVHKHYARSRGDVKAAEARPAHRTAPPAV